MAKVIFWTIGSLLCAIGALVIMAELWVWTYTGTFTRLLPISTLGFEHNGLSQQSLAVLMLALGGCLMWLTRKD